MGNPKAADFRTMQIIWAALVMSVLMYVGVAFKVVNSLNFSGGGLMPVLFPALAGICVVILGVQTIFRKQMADEKLFPRVAGTIASGSVNGSAGRDPLRQALLQNIMTLDIVLWALGEAPAIFGLVLTFLSGDMQYIAGFATYSILNMIYHRPRRLAFDEQLKRFRRHADRAGSSS